MAKVTAILLLQDGRTVGIQVDKGPVLQVSANDLRSDPDIVSRFVEDVEDNTNLVASLVKTHIESNNLIAFPAAPKRPLGLAALAEDITNA